MSANTAAIASSAANNANPEPETRRRSTSTRKIKSNGEVVAEGNDKLIVYGKEVGHTMRGESVVERSRDVLEHKKRPTTPAAPGQRRKAVAKPATPKWLTVLSILTKMCFLFVGIFWLGQMILTLSNVNRNTGDYPFTAQDYDGQISKTQESLKKTAKMLQVQLEVLDKKIEAEIGSATKELSRQFEEKGVLLEQQLKKLEARTDDLGKSLGELKDMGLFTKEEFETFKNELKKRRGVHGSGEDIGLDDIGALAKDIVLKEIEKHAADGLGRADYALASGGARVIKHSASYSVGRANNWFLAAKDPGRVHPNAQKMLEPSFGEPGQCFALQGSSGFVDIRLRTGIIPQAVTLEHVSKGVAYDRSSAPKDCVVSAWFEGPRVGQSSEQEKMDILTTFRYDLEKSSAQTFDVETSENRLVNVVRLNFTSNHGSPSHTCIYRFRVHGYEFDMKRYEASEALD